MAVRLAFYVGNLRTKIYVILINKNYIIIYIINKKLITLYIVKGILYQVYNCSSQPLNKILSMSYLLNFFVHIDKYIFFTFIIY